MKINNQYSSYREAYSSQVNSESVGKESVTPKKESVEIDISTASKQIRLGEQVEDKEHAKKISDIKKAINDVTYSVSSKELADKMFDQLKG